MSRLRDYWLNEFDWRRWESRINSFEQRIVEVGQHAVHVIVERGSGANPLPLVLTHGWPGTFIEYLDLIDKLAHPERHGGKVEQAFTVVVPSLPGYGLSPAPAAPLSPSDIARLWSQLMVDAFGVDRYVAYGSDWGSLVTALIARDFPAKLGAILITTQGFLPAISEAAPLTREERDWQALLMQRMQKESGYQLIQATKPQSLAYGHADSPLALAAWVIEKFQGWTINGHSEDPPFAMDVLLANVMLYWLNGVIAPMWLYMFLEQALTEIDTKQKIAVPAGFLLPADDLFPPAPRCFIERCWNVAHYRIVRGGHFPGLEQGDLLIEELRGFMYKIKP